MNKAQKAAASKRQKQFSSAQRSASKRGGAGMGVRPRRGGPLGFIVSFKGAALIGGVGYMYIAQRELLLRLVGMGLKCNARRPSLPAAPPERPWLRHSPRASAAPPKCPGRAAPRRRSSV